MDDRNRSTEWNALVADNVAQAADTTIRSLQRGVFAGMRALGLAGYRWALPRISSSPYFEICMVDICMKSKSCRFLITFRVSRRPREMYCGHARLCVCLCVCLSVRGRMFTLFTEPDVTWGSGRSCPPSCALLGGFAIGARVALLWHYYGNAWQSPAAIRRAHRTPHACRNAGKDSPRRR